MNLKEARKHVDLAKKQGESAATSSWEPEDAAGCVTNAFYAYENLIVAVAEAYGRTWAPSHYKKADLASELFRDKILSTDLHDTLLRMNDLRKDVSYGEPGEELETTDLEEIIAKLESCCDEVDSIVAKLEQWGANNELGNA